MRTLLRRIKAVFDRRLRGFRVVELAGVTCLTVLVLGVYFFKAGAGAEGAQIADTSKQILEEQRRVRALRAELARLETPARLEKLSRTYLGLAPVSPRKEADLASVGVLAAMAASHPAPAPPASPKTAAPGAPSVPSGASVGAARGLEGGAQ
jgi:hypothetical protein